MIKNILSNHKIFITNNAWEKMGYISNKTNLYNFIFCASSGGCNGFNYKLEQLSNNDYNSFINKKVKPIILSNEKIKILVDPLSELYLLGTTIDYVNENYNKNIYESKFIFIPDSNKISTCGCGISFSPKT